MQAEEINYAQVHEWLEDYRLFDNEAAKRKLQNFIVVACMPLVKRISRGLARRSTDPLEDLIQVGSVGLLKAVKLFDPSISKNFRVYATYLITGEIRHYLRDKASMIKAPREIQELAYRIHQITMELTEVSGEKPSDMEIAQKLEMNIAKVHEVIDVERRKQTLSLDQMNFSSEDDQQPLYDKIVDENYKELQDLQEDRIMLKSAIAELEVEQRTIIEMNFFQDLNQREIADRLQISQMQVSRKLKKALSTLFESIKNIERV